MSSSSSRRDRWNHRVALLSFLSLSGALVPIAPAWSLPSYAQQVGVACAQCHTAAFGPALTQFGREFKLNGYTLGGQKSVPLSAMLVGSFNQAGTWFGAAYYNWKF